MEKKKINTKDICLICSGCNRLYDNYGLVNDNRQCDACRGICLCAEECKGQDLMHKIYGEGEIEVYEDQQGIYLNTL